MEEAKEEPKPVVNFGKKKKTLDNKKNILGGFGGLKVKGKDLRETLKGCHQKPFNMPWYQSFPWFFKAVHLCN